MNRNRVILILAFTSVVAGLLVAGAWRRWMAGSWHNEEVTVLLSPRLSTSELIDTLSKQLPNEGSRVVDHLTMRDWTARLKPGRYTFPAHETVKQSATRLVTGQREAVKVVIPSGRDVGPVAGATARRIFADSNDVAELFMQDSMRWRIVPNTYEMWWETDVDGLADRILREHEAWWTEDRLAAARALGLSPREVTVLASIVQAETAVIREAPQVAGLYLNRLKKGMALQADPTLIFALNDPSIRRVLDVHKDVDSPYNTYKHRGLPPGPIRYVDPRYLQSVLHPAEHRFLYMCAKPGGDGTHDFARTYREHLRNARAYQNWLNQQRIYR
jgi:UPF0755 protein